MPSINSRGRFSRYSKNVCNIRELNQFVTHRFFTFWLQSIVFEMFGNRLSVGKGSTCNKYLWWCAHTEEYWEWHLLWWTIGMSVNIPITVSSFSEEIIKSKYNTTLCCCTVYSRRYCDANKTTFNCNVLHVNSSCLLGRLDLAPLWQIKFLSNMHRL